MTAVDATGVTWRGRFRVPLSDAQLAGAVQGAVAHARGGATRDIGGEPRPAPDAEGVGAALAEALLTGPVGEGYAAARTAASRNGHGVRLSLSLAAAPALLSVPWEFLYQRPRFLASQRKSPVVRLLATGVEAEAVVIDSAVRILGVVASPADQTPLDVAKERAGVEQAVAAIRELGRVELDWLEPATPRRLRETLRDGSYHVLHFIGHSAFTDAGDGVVFLEDDDGKAKAGRRDAARQPAGGPGSACASSSSTRARARGRRSAIRTPAWPRRSSASASRPSSPCSSRSATTRRSSSPPSCTST